MQYLLSLLLVVLIIQTSVAPPVSQQKKDEDHKENEVDDSEDTASNLEYHRYLKEVVDVLESDADFRAKLEKADEMDIRTGKIAHELKYVNPTIRTKLDELKREELERLKHLATKEYNLINGLDMEHLDHANTNTFEIDDLKKLIAKTTKDLAEADKRRRQEFKEYEMEKKFLQEQSKKALKEEERKNYEEQLETLRKKHKDHKPLHHPGSKQQLEEVWEKQDHMENQEFNPKTFFYLHDLDGNGFWDQDEVKTLFLKELDKLYTQGAPEADIFERREEMERMREHVFNEADLNHDGLISYDEFLEQTKKPEFTQDEGWQGLDEQQIYSQQEYEAYERDKQKDIQKLIANGMLPPPLETAHLPVQQNQFPSYQQQALPPQQYHPPQYSEQVPPQPMVGHVPPPQYQGQVPQQQHYQPQVPPQQHYPNQIPQQQQYQAQQVQYQVPQQQQQQFQAQPQQAQQQYHGQPPQVHQQMQQQNQVPQNTQSLNAPSNGQEAVNSQNLPQQQDPKSIHQELHQNSIPKVQKV